MLCGAIEGGSNYWYFLPNLEEVKNKTIDMKNYPLVDRIIKSIYDYGLSIPVNDVENDEYLGEINVDNIENAAKLMFEKYPKYFANILKEEEDVDTSDIWFQLVVMQEVVYG